MLDLNLMDDKARLILNHYKIEIEGRQFDEFTVLGFLIFIRPYLKGKSFGCIEEFCHLIAHRQRDRGRVQESISGILHNEFSIDPVTRKVKGSKGIPSNQWTEELNKMFTFFDFKASPQTLKEFTLCVFSLAQKTEYDLDLFTEHEELQNNEINKQLVTGIIDIFVDNDNQIALTQGIKGKSCPFVNFIVSEEWPIKEGAPVGVIDDPIFTVREYGELRLKVGDQYIV